MANLVIPRREILTRQPQGSVDIDYAGLGKGVQMLLMPMGNRLVDLANPHVVWAPSGNAGIKITGGGNVATFDGNGDYFSTTGYPQIVGAKGTYFQWVKRVGAFDTEGPVWLATNTGGVVAFQHTPYNDVYCFGSGRIYGVTVPPVGSERSMVFTATGTTTGNQRYYSNGVIEGAPTASAPSAFPTGNKLFNFGRFMGGSSWDVDADILIAGFTTEVWTEAQARAFHENPWQIFAPRETYVFPSLSAGGDATGSGSLSPVSVSNPTGSASGSASVTGAFAAITIAAPTATASAGGSATASGSLASLTIAAPTASASASGVGSGAWSALSISPATGTATATTSATASGSVAAISITAPTASATGTTAGNAIATATPAQITISPASASAIASAVASGVFASLSITAPTGTATSAGDAQAIAAFAALSINPATGAAYGSAIATGSLPVISVSPATGTASTGTFTGSISDADIARIVQAVLAALTATTIPVDVQKMNGAILTGSGVAGDEWGAE